MRPNGPTQITGYRASNRVTVRIRDIAKVASTIDALVAAGANEIGGINFMVSQESKVLDEARVRALEDARRKAEIYAKAANVRLGTPVSISEDGAGRTGADARPVQGRRVGAGCAGRRDAARVGERVVRDLEVNRHCNDG